MEGDDATVAVNRQDRREATMPAQDDKPENTEPDPTLEASQDDEKLLDDLDPEEEEAAGIQGGIRARGLHRA